MARRRRGRALTGWIAVDKPAGVSSATVVNRIRWQLQAQKAGHAGTLDPDATGLLIVALGEATKAVASLTDALKTYDFEVAWGTATDTDDASGTAIATTDRRPSEAAIRAALPAFRGDILQTPPQVSAVKIAGARAYDLVRSGAAPTLTARPLHVAALELTGVSSESAQFRMVCGKGGYVRAVARDLGAALGCLGHAAWLRRTQSGGFTLAGAHRFDPEGPDRDPALEAAIRPLEAGLSHLPRCLCSDQAAARIRQGNPAEVFATPAEDGALVWVGAPAPLALGLYRGGWIYPKRVFNLQRSAPESDLHPERSRQS
ncbi:MAG: tRNA pseudouridine(55) synthase TruB [Pseudomonadota bacterium]